MFMCVLCLYAANAVCNYAETSNKDYITVTDILLICQYLNLASLFILLVCGFKIVDLSVPFCSVPSEFIS
jgi:hypothetical protein